ncbi:MAG: cysteine synthase A [Clostridiales bacterium]|jgi:cysteine synthase A|nr:cysteine synthase A [Clostridiales bacterium]
MSNIYENIAELIGGTPLLALNKFAAKHGAKARILGKLESFNPLGSVKDRLALALILDAEERGLLHADSVIVEPTSGNTGIGLAAIAAARGYSCVFTMPETMSVERQRLLKFFGAKLVLTQGKRGMKGAIAKAEEIAAATPGAFIPGQFTNPANPAMHKRTTGPEIWADTGGNIDIFVAGAGTGGTISGAGAYLKSRQPDLHIVVAEPADCPVLSEGRPGLHKIQGIGPGFVPDTLDTQIYDEIITVTNDNAFETARELAKSEGLLAGISGGAAAWASLQVAKRPENEGKTIVAILPDTGERYLTTDLFE